jgi:prostaglandin E receptor 4
MRKALAFNDLLGTTATSPIVLLVYSKGRWIGGQPLCDYFSFILIFAGLVTVFIIGAMALDRFMASIDTVGDLLPHMTECCY